MLLLEIPSISLREKVYTMDSSSNVVDQHIQILKDSRIDENFFLFAGHSGSGRANYFNDLKYVKIGDLVFIFINNKRLCYVVEKMYYIEKNGYFALSSEEVQNIVYLFTCSLDYPSKQLVVQAHLVY